jgi:hypothetical protein
MAHGPHDAWHAWSDVDGGRRAGVIEVGSAPHSGAIPRLRPKRRLLALRLGFPAAGGAFPRGTMAAARRSLLSRPTMDVKSAEGLLSLPFAVAPLRAIPGRAQVAE